MNYSSLKISIHQAEDILLKLYSIKGSASPLPGELDFNFRIIVENEEGYILKISRPDENLNYLDFQQQLLQYVETNGKNLIAPKVVKDKGGNTISSFKDEYGNIRKVRLLSWVSGRVWSTVNPQLDDLRYSLGEQCGLLTKALQGFDHHEAHREFEWDVAQSLWTKNHINLFAESEKEMLNTFQNKFESHQDTYSKLRKAVVHNDANDNNVIVSEDLVHPKVKAAIDYGDAIYTQIINDLAISCAYCIMGHNDPLEAALPIIKGYHSSFPLKEDELAHLFNTIAMRLIISVTKSAINKVKEPDNDYLLISEKPAWEVLKKWYEISEDFAHYSFRNACGFTAHPNEFLFKNWSLNQKFHLTNLFPTINKSEVNHIDLSVSSKWVGHQEEFNDLELFQFKINQLQKQVPNKIIAGGYLEPRALYTSTEYDKIGNNGRESRTIHLGIDYWLPKNTPVHCLFDGEVVVAVNDAGEKEYGGLVILKHYVNGFHFYTLYGHLSLVSATKHKLGEIIHKGDKIGELGKESENGNWVPHLHFQVMLSMLNYNIDFPGVAYYKQINVWGSLCPNPNLLFKSEDLEQKKNHSKQRFNTL